jgi:hypothetical protein
MVYLVTFDAFAGTSSDITSNLSLIRAIPGVRSVEVLQAVEDRPEYCLVVEAEDDSDRAFRSTLDRMSSEYAGFISTLASRAFRQLA